MSNFSSIIYRYYAEYKWVLSVQIVELYSKDKIFDCLSDIWYNMILLFKGENNYDIIF